MSWISLAVLVIVSSVVLYLSIRKARDFDVSIEVQNLMFFLPPAIILPIYDLVRGLSFHLTGGQFLLIAISAVLFSWLGNIASLRGLQAAPNPGYSLLIAKSYVVLTAILSIWLFDSPLTPKDMVAILFIIAFSALILIDKKRKNTSSRAWVLFTLYAFFAFGFLALAMTELTRQGVPSTVILFYVMALVSVLILSELKLKRRSLPQRKAWGLLLLAGIAATFFNVGQVEGFKLAPNPGYISAANAGSIALLTLLSAALFKDELSFRKLVGVLGVFAGLVILFL